MIKIVAYESKRNSALRLSKPIQFLSHKNADSKSSFRRDVYTHAYQQPIDSQSVVNLVVKDHTFIPAEIDEDIQHVLSNKNFIHREDDRNRLFTSEHGKSKIIAKRNISATRNTKNS